MKTCTVSFSDEVFGDINQLVSYIRNDLGMPLTAVRYRAGILHKIDRLCIYGASIAPSQSAWLQLHFGTTIRHIRYKQMAILFTVHGHRILIKRVIPAKLIR